MTEKNVDWDVKNQIKQTKYELLGSLNVCCSASTIALNDSYYITRTILTKFHRNGPWKPSTKYLNKCGLSQLRIKLKTFHILDSYNEK